MNSQNSKRDFYINRFNELFKEHNELLQQYEDVSNKYNNSLKENQELSNKYNELLSTRRNELTAGSFCNVDIFDYFFREDFPEKLNKMLKNLPSESRHMFKFLFLRSIAVTLLKKDSLFTNEEINEQKYFTQFKLNNVVSNNIGDFKFINSEFNLHCFINDPFSDKDKEFLNNKDIIDAGAFTGDSSLPFSKLTSKNVYAFEPFKDSFNKLVQNIELNNIKNIVPVNYSLSDKIGESELYLSGNNFQGITSDSTLRDYDQVIKIHSTTVDDFVEKNDLDVGFIKVDVEGDEQNLLKGAIDTIKSQRPILFLSIYHNVNDLFEIKPWIEDLDLDYKFKLNKEQPWTFIADTILECRPY